MATGHEVAAPTAGEYVVHHLTQLNTSGHAQTSIVDFSVLNLDTDEEQTYRIVGDDEADFKQNLISVNSPIARGLIGKEQDDVVTIRTPGGEVEYEITKVEYL